MVYMTYLLIVFSIVCLDQISKYLIVNTLDLYEKKVIIKDFFALYRINNTGASFSILEGKQYFFYIVTIIAIIVLTYYLLKIKKKNYFKRIALLMMIGGAIGNFIDRVRFKYVCDFLSFTFFGYDFAVFNIADCFLTVGVFILLIIMFMESKNAKN